MSTTMTPALADIPVDQLRPNPWNPNVMSDDEFAELVAEVKHLGRLPKPVVVRENCDGFEIVDGEHNWRAAAECRFPFVPCEVVDAGDFEAMRQTYKRNQHGKHDPVKEGQLWEQMLAQPIPNEKDRSVRQLAKEIGVSDGTIRNGLLYAKAAEAVRNHYALWEQGHPGEPLRNGYAVADLPVKHVRELCDAMERQPHIAVLWLECSYGRTVGPDLKEWRELGKFFRLSDETLLDHLPADRSWCFKASLNYLTDWRNVDTVRCRGIGTKEQRRPYLRHYFADCPYLPRWEVDDVMNLIWNASTEEFVVTPEEFEAAIEACDFEPDSSYTDFYNRLTVMVRDRVGDPDKLCASNAEIRAQLEEGKIAAISEDIAKSSLPPETRIELAEFYENPSDVNSYFETYDSNEVRAVVLDLAKRDKLAGSQRLLDRIRSEVDRRKLREELQEELNSMTEASLAMAIVGTFWGDSEDAKSMFKRLAEALNKVELVALYQLVKNKREMQEHTAMIVALAAKMR